MKAQQQASEYPGSSPPVEGRPPGPRIWGTLGLASPVRWLSESSEVLFAAFLTAGVWKSHPGLAALQSRVDLTVALAGVLLLACLCRLLREGRNLRLTRLPAIGCASFALLGLVLLAGLLHGADGAYGIQKALRFATLTSLGFAGGWLLAKAERGVVRIAWSFFGIAVVLGLFAMANISMEATGHPLSPSGSPIGISRVAGLGLVGALLLLAPTVRRRLSLIGVIAGASTLAVLIYLPGARGPVVSLLGTAIGCLVVGLAIGPKPERRFGRRQIGALGLAAIAGLLLTSPFWVETHGGLATRLRVLYSEGGASATARLNLAEEGVKELKENAWIGTGTGSFGRAPGDNAERSYPHNLVLEVAAENGILGLLPLMVLLLVAFLVLWIEVWVAVGTRRTMILFLGGATVFLLGNALLSGDINDNRLFFAFLGMSLACARGTTKPRISEPAEAEGAVDCLVGKGVRIAHVTTVHPAMDTRVLHRECRSLARAGYEVALIARSATRGHLHGVEIHPLRTGSNRAVRMLVGPVQAFAHILRLRPRLCHFHDPELIPLGWLCRLLGIRVVMDLHEDVPEQVMAKRWLPSPVRRLVSLLARLAIRTLPHTFDAVACATDYIASTVPGGRTVVVRNFPPADAVRPAPVEHRAGGLSAIYVGGLSEERGIFQMIEAMQRLPHQLDVRLTLIGRAASPETESAVRRVAQSAPERILMLGWLPPEEVWRRLAEADIGLVCLHPVFRYQVALPVKLFEYMAAGLPVISSDFALWREIIDDAQCGLCVDPLDSDALARAIAILSSDPNRRAQMGSNGRRAMQEKYNWEQESRKLLQLYAEVLNP